MLSNIFSVKYDGQKHTQVNILGLKIKIKTSLKDRKYYHYLPIQNNKIVFRNHTGSYGCNVKYISEEILRQKLPYDIVWVVNKHILNFLKDYPKNVRLVMDSTSEAYKEYATAKIWVDSERRYKFTENGLFKRDNQIYIQTFHGSLGIKRTGADRTDVSKSSLRRIPFTDAKQIDYLISNGTFTSEYLKRIFFNYGKILQIGHPRNDIFFKDNTKIKEKVYKELKIPNNKKIILYAPTLREDRDFSYYNLNFDKVVKSISKKFNNEYIILLRLHPLVSDLKDSYLHKFNGSIIDVTDYSDMQELLVATDILITDYSSCIFDFMLQYKPGFIFASDRKKYEKGRGLYYPLSSTPFPVAENNEDLIKNIENFDYEKYKTEVKEFLADKGCIDDGHASERVVELIKNIIDKAQSKEEVTQ